ncbi:1620_t:CDS:2, partial [Cetraspora pellucida]
HPSQVKVKLIVPLLEKDPQKTQQIIKKISQPPKIIQKSGLSENSKRKLMEKLVKPHKYGLVPLKEHQPYSVGGLRERYGMDWQQKQKIEQQLTGKEFHYEEPDQDYEIPLSGEANFLKKEEERFQAWQKVYHPDKPSWNFKENWADYLLERKSMIRLEKQLKGFFKKGYFPANIPK